MVKAFRYFLFGLVMLALLSSCATFTTSSRDKKIAERATALIAEIERLSSDGLHADLFDVARLRMSLSTNNAAQIDREAQDLFRRAAIDLNAGFIKPSDRQQWSINSSPDLIAISTIISKVFENNDFAVAFAAVTPEHDQYQRLKQALAVASDPETRELIALNMERWRWMPRELGDDFILVNVAAFEMFLYQQGEQKDRRPVIVGSASTPTLQFAGVATGVIFNPTWYIPVSIVDESVGALMKENPDRATELGYFTASNNTVRQKPGPANALGRMKIVMPNPYSVYLHDTPGKAAFKQNERALSHGCIRVSDAAGFAKLLLRDSLSDDEFDQILETVDTREIEFEKPLPVYIGYFTAFVDEDGVLSTYADVYDLDTTLLPFFANENVMPGKFQKDQLAVVGCPTVKLTSSG